jgi:hypothetical protein
MRNAGQAIARNNCRAGAPPATSVNWQPERSPYKSSLLDFAIDLIPAFIDFGLNLIRAHFTQD